MKVVLKCDYSWNGKDNCFRRKKARTLVNEFETVLYPTLNLTHPLVRVIYIMLFYSSCIIFTAKLFFGKLFV